MGIHFNAVLVHLMRHEHSLKMFHRKTLWLIEMKYSVPGQLSAQLGDGWLNWGSISKRLTKWKVNMFPTGFKFMTFRSEAERLTARLSILFMIDWAVCLNSCGVLHIDEEVRVLLFHLSSLLWSKRKRFLLFYLFIVTLNFTYTRSCYKRRNKFVVGG